MNTIVLIRGWLLANFNHKPDTVGTVLFKKYLRSYSQSYVSLSNFKILSENYLWWIDGIVVGNLDLQPLNVISVSDKLWKIP
jgi:hypothetical protein